jgi:hypothetical protein
LTIPLLTCSTYQWWRLDTTPGIAELACTLPC